MATKNIQEGDRVQSSSEIQAEGKLDIASSDNPAVQVAPEPEADVVMHARRRWRKQRKGTAERGRNGDGEEAPEEGDQTKEGKPAEAGEKRERPTVTEEGEDKDKASAEELEEAEKETGKEVKKPKTGEEHGTEEHHEGKKAAAPKKRRHSKASAKSKPKPAAAPAEGKRPVGRPRKASTVAAKAQEAPQEGQQAKEVAEDQKMEEDTIPAHHTRSRT
ncbi:hypothetical protein BDZ97DRAFT_1762996 [Flammula alnicola]|nr:hypothetical protein BDZ97DRAFT_1762996 [Flammula alnicola]